MSKIGLSSGRAARSGGFAAVLCLALAAGVSTASAEDASPAGAQPHHFRINDSFCFMPCMNAMKTSAKDHRSNTVTISRAELSGPMIAPCEGRVAVAVKDGTQKDVMDELHRRYGDEALTSAAQIDLPTGPFKMGTATCTPKGGAASTFARLLSIEPERVTLLTDSGIVYELVPAR